MPSQRRAHGQSPSAAWVCPLHGHPPRTAAPRGNPPLRAALIKDTPRNKRSRNEGKNSSGNTHCRTRRVSAGRGGMGRRAPPQAASSAACSFPFSASSRHVFCRTRGGPLHGDAPAAAERENEDAKGTARPDDDAPARRQQERASERATNEFAPVPVARNRARTERSVSRRSVVERQAGAVSGGGRGSERAPYGTAHRCQKGCRRP